MNIRDQVYESIGVGYAAARRPDPRIHQVIVDSLGDARIVINMGAGAGNYEQLWLTVSLRGMAAGTLWTDVLQLRRRARGE